jgi:hypothetical protein
MMGFSIGWEVKVTFSPLAENHEKLEGTYGKHVLRTPIEFD